MSDLQKAAELWMTYHDERPESAHAAEHAQAKLLAVNYLTLAERDRRIRERCEKYLSFDTDVKDCDGTDLARAVLAELDKET